MKVKACELVIGDRVVHEDGEGPIEIYFINKRKDCVEYFADRWEDTGRLAVRVYSPFDAEVEIEEREGK